MSARVFNQARVSKASGLLVFAEFELYNDAGVNIAPQGTATATSTGWDGLPEYAIDGSSNDSVASCYHSAGTDNEAWTLTLDRPYSQTELVSVGLLGRGIGSNHASALIELLSTDGQPPLVLGTTENTSYQTFSVPTGPTVTWVLDANSRYEISSKEHLLQLMHQGALYTNIGSVPSDWILSSFIQTADIDLEGDSTNIVPIGTGVYTEGFRGEYDGNGFTIFNWVYVDPNYPGVSSDSGEYSVIGLFGSITRTGVVKNVRMAGVCSISGFYQLAGFLTGSTLQTASVYNVEVDLSPGSFIANSNDSTTGSTIGGVIGNIYGAGPFVALTLKGELEILPSTNDNAASVGGVVGSCHSTNGTLFRNLATFTSPLNGQRVGGVIGRLRYSNVTKLMNAMNGDINGTYAVGSVVGEGRQSSATNVFAEYVSSMKGTVTASGVNSNSGGVLGWLDQEPGATVHSLFNYMSGDVVNTWTADNAGGLFSRGDTNTNILTSINAMNGSVRMPTVSSPSSGAEANVDTSFGLTYEVERNITTTPITGLPTDQDTGLPIFDLAATDPDGFTHTFDFVLGNLPMFDLLPTAGVTSISATVVDVPGAVTYQIKFGESPSETTLTHTGISAGDFTFEALAPETTYTLQLYADTGSGYSLVDTETVTTLANSAVNYDTSVYNSNGKFDLSTLDSSSFSLLKEVINDVFSTGDKLEINLGSSNKSEVAFVKVGEAVSTEDSIFVPFDSAGGSGQVITMNLSDTSSVSVTYDDVNNALNIGGSTVQVGESVVVDGKKLTVKDL